MAEATQTIGLRYRGSSSQYVDFAVRGDEHLGISVDYAINSKTKSGGFVVRFVAHGTVDPDNYKHLTIREHAKFATMGSDHVEMFEGVRLNKIGIPVFQPAILARELDHFALKFGVWSKLETWITQQATLEGFTVNVDLQKEIRNLLIPNSTPEDSVSCVIDFPDLSAPAEKATALKLVQKAEADEDEDDETDDEDEKPGWLN